MDDFGKKLTNMFKSKPKKFQGTGHKLGGASQNTGSSSAPKPTKPEAVSKPVAAPQRTLGFADSPPTGTQTPFTGVSRKTTADTAQTSQESRSGVPGHGPASSDTHAHLRSNTPSIAPVDPVQTDDTRVAVAMLLSNGELGLQASATITRVLGNIAKNPSEAKYRSLKRTNQRIAAMLAIPGAAELLGSVGFEEQENDSDALVLHPDTPLGPLTGALELLQSTAQRTDHSATPPAASSPAPTSPSRAEAAAAVPPGAEQHTAMPDPSAAATAAAAQATRPPQQPQPSDALETGPPSGSQAAAALISSEAAGAVSNAAPAQERLGLSPEEWRAQHQHRVIEVGGAKLQHRPQVSSTAAARKPAAAAPGPGPNEASEPPAPPEKFSGRNTRVVVPVHANAEVSDDFFKRTNADVRREFARARQRREESEVLMTRAMREKRAAANRRVHLFATIRVRVPEGVFLEGHFKPEEPTTAIFTWVEAHLQEPDAFVLASPALATKNKQLPSDCSVKEAGLMPSFLLNLRWTDASAPRRPALSQEALQLVTMDAPDQ